MTSDISALAALLGYEPAPPAWDLGTAEHVPMHRWGKDHWSTFAYVETRWVDHRGMLGHDHMRCDADRHHAFYGAKRRALTPDLAARHYPTRLKTERPAADGTWGSVDLPGHDDYDCLGDAIAEGLIEVRMPVPRKPHGDIFLDAWGRVVKGPGGEVLDPSFVTGLTEMWLMTAASFALTARGQAVAGELRAHLAMTRRSHQFMPAELRKES